MYSGSLNGVITMWRHSYFGKVWLLCFGLLVLSGASIAEGAESTANLVQALGSSDWQEREQASASLVALGSEAVQPLSNALNDKRVRVYAAETLWKINEPKSSKKAIQTLVSCLDDKDWKVRNYAVWVLNKVDDPDAVKALKARNSYRGEESKPAASARTSSEDTKEKPASTPSQPTEGSTAPAKTGAVSGDSTASHLEASSKEISAKVEGLKRELAQLESKKKNFEDDSKNVESKKTALENEVHALEAKIKELLKSVSDSEIQLKNIKESLSAAAADQKRLKSLDGEKAQLMREVEAAKREKEKLFSEMKLAEEKKLSADSGLSSLAETKKRMEAEIKSLEGKKSAFLEELKKAEADKAAAIKSADELKPRRDSHEKEIAELSQKRDRLLQELQDLEVKKKNSVTAVTHVERNLAEANRAVSELKRQQADLEKTLRLGREQLDSLKLDIELAKKQKEGGGDSAVQALRIERLIAQLGSRSRSERVSASEQLAGIGPPAVPALIAALKTNDERVSYWAERTLQIIGTPQAQAAIKEQNESQQMPSGTGGSEVKTLIKNLDHPEWKVRRFALWRLKQIGTPEALRAVENYRESRL